MWLTVYLLVMVSITRCNSLFTSWSWSASPDVTHCLPLGHGQHHPMRLTVYLLVMVCITWCDSLFTSWSWSASPDATHCLPLGHGQHHHLWVAQHYHLWLSVYLLVTVSSITHDSLFTTWSCPTLSPVTDLLVMPNINTCDSPLGHAQHYHLWLTVYHLVMSSLWLTVYLLVKPNVV